MMDRIADQTMNGNVGIGTTGPKEKFVVKYPFARTDTTARVAMVLGSNEESGYHQLYVQGIGAAAQANRAFLFQTSQEGTGDGGVIALQPNAGNVGIGTTSPSQRLQVGQGGGTSICAPTNTYCPSSFARGNSGVILAGSGNADGTGWAYGSRLVTVDYGDGLGTSFDTLVAGPSWTNDALFISGRSGRNGYIGIGTTVPTEKLDVNGNLKVSGWIAGDAAPTEYVQEYTDDHCTALDSAGFLHIRTSINADAAWQPKFIEVKGFHSYGGEWTHDFKAVVNTTDTGVFSVRSAHLGKISLNLATFNDDA